MKTDYLEQENFETFEDFGIELIYLNLSGCEKREVLREELAIQRYLDNILKSKQVHHKSKFKKQKNSNAKAVQNLSEAKGFFYCIF